MFNCNACVNYGIKYSPDGPNKYACAAKKNGFTELENKFLWKWLKVSTQIKFAVQ